MENNLDIEEIIDEYSNYVFKIINNTIGTSLPYQDKEEAVSDVFYLLWKNQDKIESDLKSYLGTIARNVAYQKLRNNKCEIEFNDLLPINYKMPKESSYIDEILANLTKKEYELFYAYYIKGLKIKEIAKLKHKSVSAIKMRLSRMKKKIREEFNK